MRSVSDHVRVNMIGTGCSAADDNFYGGVSASPAYDSIENQQRADAVSAEEQAAREQMWRAELAKVGNSVEMCKQKL